MFRIGEFSKLAKTTVKTLRFYEEAGLFFPQKVDEWTGYRYYTTEQLYPLQEITALRQAGLSIEEIRAYLNGGEKSEILKKRRQILELEQAKTENCLGSLDALLKSEKENSIMNYKAVINQLPEYTVYYKQGVIKNFDELTQFILSSAEECTAANPDIKCTEPDYCYVSYLDPEFKPENMMIEYAQAVTKARRETETIKFKTLAPCKAVCVYHKGAYSNLSEAYAFALNWIKQNGYQIAGLPRERYIDGIWNKENTADWLTEIQIPVSNYSEEVKEKWGETKAYKEDAEKQSNQVSAELESVREAEKIFSEFAAIRDSAPDSDQAMALVKLWQDHITKYHYNCTKEILSGLGQMYIGDERFKENLDSHGEGTALFISRAIENYCK